MQDVDYLRIVFLQQQHYVLTVQVLIYLTKQNLSHYQMLNQIEAKFKEWSPACFLGYSSINFDDEVIRKEFFKTLREPYITNTKEMLDMML